MAFEPFSVLQVDLLISEDPLEYNN
jgi:hypothetical protein